MTHIDPKNARLFIGDADGHYAEPTITLRDGSRVTFSGTGEPLSSFENMPVFIDLAVVQPLVNEALRLSKLPRPAKRPSRGWARHCRKVKRLQVQS